MMQLVTKLTAVVKDGGRLLMVHLRTKDGIDAAGKKVTTFKTVRLPKIADAVNGGQSDAAGKP